MKNFIKKKKLIIFDLDGVLINSRLNMRLAWQYTAKINKLKNKFNEYFKHIGLPFFKILEEMGIEKNFEKIKKDYDKGSIRNIKKIRSFPNVPETISYLREHNKKLAIFTSKDEKRTKIFLKKINLKFDHIECGKKSIKGKPFPDQIKRILKKLKFSKKQSVYIGDMYHDYLSAKNAKIDFIFAKYGYGGLRIIEIKRFINKFDDLA